MDCEHLYGILMNSPATEVNYDNYSTYGEDLRMLKFTYCPFCRIQLHTIDGIPLGLPQDDDCIRGGCED